MGTIWFRPSQTIFFDKYRRDQFEDDENVGESSLDSNEDATIEKPPPRGVPRLQDVYVVDENINSYATRTATQPVDDEPDIMHSSNLFI